MILFEPVTTYIYKVYMTRKALTREDYAVMVDWFQAAILSIHELPQAQREALKLKWLTTHEKILTEKKRLENLEAAKARNGQTRTT